MGRLELLPSHLWGGAEQEEGGDQGPCTGRGGVPPAGGAPGAQLLLPLLPPQACESEGCRAAGKVEAQVQDQATSAATSLAASIGLLFLGIRLVV